MLRPTSTRSFLKTTTATVIAATLALTLTACFTNPLEKIASGGVGKIVEQATGGQLEVGSGGSMPKDFPAEVPLVSTDVVTSFSMKVEDGKAWTIGVRAAGSLDQVSDQVQAAFAQGDWEEMSWGTFGDEMVNGMFTSEAHKTNVIISVMIDDDSGKVLVSYVVSKDVE